MSSAKWRPFCLGLNVLMGLTVRSILRVYGVTGGDESASPDAGKTFTIFVTATYIKTRIQFKSRVSP